MGRGPVRRPTGRVAGAAFAAAIVAFVVIGATDAVGRVHADDTGQVCTRETLLWTGTARLGGSQRSVDTGLAVAAPGTGVALRTAGVSADGLAADGSATALTVFVGAAPAVPGATVPGGVVRLQYGGTVDVVVNGATVVLERCAMVASGAPAFGSAPAGALPRTGVHRGMAAILVAVSLGCIGAGCGFAALARWRTAATAGGRGLR
jgi:hypothetical protein